MAAWMESVGLPIIVCLFALWFVGLLFIPAGVYLLKREKTIDVWVKGRSLRAFNVTPIDKKDVEVSVTTGKVVRRQGAITFALGAFSIITFVILFVDYWRLTSNFGLRVFLVIGLVAIACLDWWLVQTR
jgi:cadmium resistance protein CadD (predicted permease)